MRFCSMLAAVILGAGCTAAPTSTSAQSAPAAAPTAGAQGEVLAVVNGTTITEADLRKSAGLELSRLERQLYDLKQQQLDTLVAKHLMEAEARRRGVTIEAFEAAEISSGVSAVTDAEIDSFIEANRARIRGDVTQLRPQVRDFLRELKLEARRATVVADLRKGATVDIKLAPPAPFRAEVDLVGAPVRGAATAPITIVEYSDFHCPFCRRVQPTLTTLLDKYKGQVRLVYKHLPLDGLHPQARRVSEASWCAGQQDRFWQFHDAVYAESTPDSSDAALARLGAAAGLDAAKFTSCLANPEAKAAVQRDVTQGEALGLSSTPGFFINGREVRGAQPLEAFAAIIDEELRGSRR
ncbi:MAG TPA: thioredoxin domain-containing protein [Luteitalea sp.]|nr:thioredoxin domain-containing protein [Luteitalea sp.]